jgi:hypothetical protein
MSGRKHLSHLPAANIIHENGHCYLHPGAVRGCSFPLNQEISHPAALSSTEQARVVPEFGHLSDL